MKAMIFAAGIGSRLKEFTHNTPKCLMALGSSTILEHVISQLKQVGVQEIVINLHHFPEQITNYLKQHSNFGLTVHLSHEPELLDTGGGLKQAKRYFEGERAFLVHNSDIYCTQSLAPILEAHKVRGSIATLGTMRRQSKRGLYFNSDSQLVGWTEESIAAPLDSALRAFSGISVCSSEIFNFMDSRFKFSIVESFLAASRATGRVHSAEIDPDKWVDIGTPEKLADLRAKLGISGSIL
jgi:NDP-sugar pyrophosphorylase family protein